MENNSLEDLAIGCLRRIRQADDVTALRLMKDFGAKAFERGWIHAALRIKTYADEFTRE
ncbi:MAG: hypothetical protein ACM31O_14040 [Bacteroidota bacterium]